MYCNPYHDPNSGPAPQMNNSLWLITSYNYDPYYGGNYNHHMFNNYYSTLEGYGTYHWYWEKMYPEYDYMPYDPYEEVTYHYDAYGQPIYGF